MKESKKEEEAHIIPMQTAFKRAKNMPAPLSCKIDVIPDIANHSYFQHNVGISNWILSQHEAKPEWVAIEHGDQVIFMRALVPRQPKHAEETFYLITLQNGHMYEVPAKQNQGITLICNKKAFKELAEDNWDLFLSLIHI